ncbi:YhzD family protein [Bacillus sp. FJAT-45350]|uniref:YhzD family protein n=1 Tax=Bacillus sp. FJAT-45350 TaxID=2011014 RepID=UPI000BB9BA73|nr:YhzD family protein [Bacillus sp. FJAT-45350]
MKDYFLTVFSSDGEKLLGENFQASTDDEAKQIAEKRLTEENLQEHTSRLTSAGKLLLFHR